MSDDTRTTELKRRQVGRRDLLKLGATSAVLPAMIGPAITVDKPTKATTTAHDDAESLAASGPLAIGYWSGNPDTEIVHARELSSGDASLANHQAEIQMVGMGHSTHESAATLQSLAVDLNVGQATYRAWRYDNTLVRNVSSPATFSVPVESKHGLTFTVSAVHGAMANVIRNGRFTLSTGKGSAVPKLRNGYYILALGKNGRKPKISWAGYEIAGDSTGQSFYLRKSGKPVTDFPYLIFTIGPARPSSANYI